MVLQTGFVIIAAQQSIMPEIAHKITLKIFKTNNFNKRKDLFPFFKIFFQSLCRVDILRELLYYILFYLFFLFLFWRIELSAEAVIAACLPVENEILRCNNSIFPHCNKIFRCPKTYNSLLQRKISIMHCISYYYNFL